MPKVIIEIAKGANADQVLAALKAQLGGVADSISLVSENTKRLEKEQRKAEGAFKSVASSLDPVIRKSLEYERSQRALDEALKRNIISEAEHSRLLGLAKARYQEAATASVSFAQRSQNAIGGLLGTLGKAQFLIGGLGALGAGLGLGAAIEEAREAQREVALLDAQMANLPATSSITAAAVKQHAAEIGAAFAFDAEEVIRAERGLIRYGVTSEQVLRQASELSADVARSLGIGLTEAAAMVGKALQEPGEGMKALKAAGLGLSDSQIELAKHLAETGQASEAQRLVVASLRDEVEGAAAAYRDTFDGALAAARVSAADLSETIGTALLPGLRDLLNTFAEIGDSPLVARSLGNVGETLSGVALGASKSIGLIDQLSEKLRDLTGLDLADVWSFVDPLHLEMILRSSDATEELAAKVRDLAAASAAAAEAERRRREAEKASRAEAAETLALSRKSHSDMVAITARWGQESAAVTAELDRQESQLQSLLDTLDPVSAIYRKLGEDEDALRGYFERTNVPIQKQNELLATLAGRAAAAAGALEFGAQQIPLIEINREELRRQVQEIAPKDMPVELHASMTISQDGYSDFEKQSDAAVERLAANAEAGLLSAGETFLMDLAMKSDDAWEDLGDNLTQVLIQSVAEWLTAQLAAIAKAAIAAKAIQGGTGAGGGGGWMSSLGSMFGGGSGAGLSSGAMALGAWVAVAAAAVAVLKHQNDSRDGQRYNTSVRINTYEGGGSSSYMDGKLRETGAKVEAAFNELLSRMQQASGAFINGSHSASIAIQNNKEEFQARIDGVLIGVFKTAEEAMVAAMKALFSSENLSRQVDPIVQQVIDNFDTSKGADAFLEAVQSVSGIVDGLSGLTDIELALRDIPAQASQLTTTLHEMGVAMGDASSVAAEWTVQQLSSIRDQITGHQMSEAEQRAEKERQATYFNAQLALNKANMVMMQADIENKLAYAKAHVNITNWKYEFDKGQLDAELALANQGADIAAYELTVREAAANASITMLEAQLAAINQAMAALDAIKPIDFREIRLPGRRGGGGGGAGNFDAGPSEAEQRVLDFEAFLEQRSMVGLSNLQQRLAELDAAYAEQAQAASEVAGGEERLAAARAAELAALREELIDGLSLPMESARDRFREMAEVLQYLRDTTERTAESSERYSQILSELTDQANQELLGIAADLAETMGLDSDAAELRLMMAEAEWDLKVAEFQFLFMQYSALGLISDEVAARLKIIFEALNDPANRPDFSLPTAPSGGGNNYDNQQDEALQAQRELISALEDLADLQRELWASNLSPLNAEQQTQFLAGQLQDAYNQAQASGSAEDVRAFQDLVRDYLSSYQDAYGSTGGYTSEFLRINDLINNLLAMGGIGGVVPGPGMLGGNAGTGTGGWRPTPGASGTVVPFERTGGPGSPLVVESPALTAIATLAAETNRRLAALEAGIGGLRQVTASGNEAAAARAFTAGRTISASQPRFQKRGA